MHVALLGPLEVRDQAGALVEVGGRRSRTLLGLLALSAGQVVTSTRLIEGVWGDEPPPNPANALQALVSRLRRALPDGVLESRPAGYRLAIEPAAVDVRRFERLVSAGRADLPEHPERAVATLTEGLELWRGLGLADGGTLADLTGAGFARAEAARLDELRMTATEDRAAAALRLGDGRSVVPDLEALLTAYPTRERTAGLLMRALVAAGRAGDALTAYQRLRTALADRLGTDPSPELAALHRAVLRGDPDLLPQPEAGTGAEAGRGRSVRDPAEPTHHPRHYPSGSGAERDREPAPESRAGGPAGADTRDASRHNLRAELTSFVGRDREVAKIHTMLTRSRLTTLLGPGGSGKTRLAVESARTLPTPPPDGIWLVELAPLTEPAELPQAVLAVLGLRDGAVLPSGRSRSPAPPAPEFWAASVEALERHLDAVDDPVGRLVGALAGRRLLLVLDNCEHLVEAAAKLADKLLRDCPELQILATSREPLGITGETLWPVEPLALPPGDATASHARSYPAVRLLADRAAAARPEFSVDEQTVGAVVGICRALDGLPLAIELAAARLRTMTAEQLAERLDRHVQGSNRTGGDGPGARFRLLTGGSRIALPRHQTLRAVVDWSWYLLDKAERALLRRLAYFSGGATLPAAERVCAGGEVPPDRVLDLLTALAEKSMVVTAGSGSTASPEATDVAPGGDGEPRYQLLETIRAYGLAQLAEAGETEQVRRAHAAYFLELAETAEPHLRTGDQLDWLARLKADHANLQAAVRGVVAAGDAPAAVRLVAALGWYWWLGGHRWEGAELAGAALALPPGPSPPSGANGPASRSRGRSRQHRVAATPRGTSPPRGPAPAPDPAPGEVDGEAKALAYAVGGLNVIDGPYDEALATEWFQAAVALAEGTGKRHPLLRMVGPIKVMFTELAECGPHKPDPEVMGPLLADPDRWVRATARVMRAHLELSTGREPGAARADLEAALAESRNVGDRWVAGFTLTAMAELTAWRGEFTTAVTELEEAIRLLVELGARDDLVPMRLRLAHLLWLLGDRERADAELAAGRRDADRSGVRWCHTAGELAAGELARWEGDLPAARSLLTLAQERIADAPAAPQLLARLAGACGYLEVAEGDLAAARTRHAEAMKFALASNDAPVIAWALVGYADLALAEGDPARAAELLGASVTIRGTEDRSQPDADRVGAAARAALGEPAFAEAYARGHTATLASVRDLAESGESVAALRSERDRVPTSPAGSQAPDRGNAARRQPAPRF